MPPLLPYKKELTYSYAPGIYPSRVCLEARPSLARRLLLQNGARGEGVDALVRLAEQNCVRVEYADRILARIGGDAVHAAVVFDKLNDALDVSANHILLVNPSDAGNIGTIARSMVGFGFRDLAIITPAADCFDPKTVRASMGALLLVRVARFADYEEYAAAVGERALRPFMLDTTAERLSSITNITEPYTLAFGNEGTGLPAFYANLGKPIMIEQSSDIDSLNLAVASSIAMHSFSLVSGLR